ncbi:MAG: hypothetical protein PF487_09350 [Bacteroidales bacterium]|jgi:hypothetical protein|nr:hypothetical protein [Bacteroidales bacterium]
MKSKIYTITSEQDTNIVISFDVNFVDGVTIEGSYKKKFDTPVLLVKDFVDNYDLLLDDDWLTDKIHEIYQKTLIKREELIQIDSMFKEFKTFDFPD